MYPEKTYIAFRQGRRIQYLFLMFGRQKKTPLQSEYSFCKISQPYLLLLFIKVFHINYLILLGVSRRKEMGFQLFRQKRWIELRLVAIDTPILFCFQCKSSFLKLYLYLPCTQVFHYLFECRQTNQNSFLKSNVYWEYFTIRHISIYKVVIISICLFVCMSDHNS